MRMRKNLVMIVALAIAIGMAGCMTGSRLVDPLTSQPVTSEMQATMTPNEVSALVTQAVLGVDERVTDGIAKGLLVASTTVEAAKPFLPPVWRSLAKVVTVALLAAYGLNQRVGKVKLKKSAKSWQDYAWAVENGARITAATINEIVKPVAETWAAFKEAQTDKETSNVIMPDKIMAARKPIRPPDEIV